MKKYTLTIDFFSHIDEKGFLTILYPLINPCSDYKICIDKNARLLDVYIRVSPSDCVNGWITMLSDRIADVIGLDYDFNNNVDDYKIAEMTSLINGACATIVHSSQTFPIALDQDNCVTINNKKIEVIERSAAEKEINNTNVQHISIANSQIACGNSVIKNSTINN